MQCIKNMLCVHVPCPVIFCLFVIVYLLTYLVKRCAKTQPRPLNRVWGLFICYYVLTYLVKRCTKTQPRPLNRVWGLFICYCIVFCMLYLSRRPPCKGCVAFVLPYQLLALLSSGAVGEEG